MLKPRFALNCMLLLTLSLHAGAQATGYWHTAGNQIVDSNNNAVRIAGVNWYGFETGDAVAHGLWAQDYKFILNAIHSNGYNTVRIPLSNQMVETPGIPSNLSFNNSSGAINSDLSGLNSLQILDKIVGYAGQIGLRVILDNHRSEAGNSAESNGLWYTSSYPETAWINDWVALATRYAGNSTVVGMDLRNEPHNATSGGACWGCGGATDWRLAAARGGNAVLAVNSNLLIFVEGTDCVNGDCTWWGGNLEGVSAYPVSLNVSNRLVYSAHDYGPTEYNQSWFNSSTTAASLDAFWSKHWAYVSQNNIAPVWVGEFGTTNNSADISNSAAGSQGQWFQSLIALFSSNPNLSWTYWALNGEDTYGLLDNQYDAAPPSAAKQSALASIQSSSISGGGQCQAKPGTPQSVLAQAVSSSQINVSWGPVIAPSNCSITYNVYGSSGANFAPGAGNLLASGLGGNSYAAKSLSAGTTYYFVVASMDTAGSSAYSSYASASTQPAAVVPAPPSNLVATATSSSNIQLGWQSSSTAGVTYNVYESTTSGFLPAQAARIATGVSGTSFTAGGLQASTGYYFLVTAVLSGSESSASNQASATTKAAVSAAVACHISYVLNSQWNTGFNVGLSIQNTGTSAINGWTLTWTWSGNQSISQAWNANLVAAAPKVVLTNVSWNPAIGPGSSATGIGFNGSYSGSNANPTAFFLNGFQCQ